MTLLKKISILMLTNLICVAAQASQTIYLQENFEDTHFKKRGWYDDPRASLTQQNAKQGKSAFECYFFKGKNNCFGGAPMRHAIPETESVYMSYWIRFSDEWEIDESPTQSHVFYFITNADNKWAAPAMTHLTAYVEHNGGKPLIQLQDSKNIDRNCILKNDDSIIGCNGDFTTYQFSENRSVSACNGLIGDLDGRDCYGSQAQGFSSYRRWFAPYDVITNRPGPRYKGNWHFVEAYLKMNRIITGKGIPDGKIRIWVNGRIALSHDRILMRTGAHPKMKFNQLLFSPHVSGRLSKNQVMWIDQLIVASEPPKNRISNKVP